MNKAEALKLVFTEQNRKPLHKILKELTHCYFLEREIPFYYFTSLLHKENTGDYKQFIGHQKLERSTRDIGSAEGSENLEDKLKFGNILESNSIRTPKILAHSDNHTIYSTLHSTTINSVEELTLTINELIATSENQSVFVKPIDGVGGDYSFKFAGIQLPENKAFATLLSLLDTERFIFQETIQQHEAINAIYGNSINTLRVHTFFNRRENKVDTVSALMRFGKGGSIVDNGSSGGFFVPINTDTWKIEGIGRSYLKSGGDLYTYHPDSNILLDGFPIPHAEMIAEELMKAAKLFEKDFIGWDIAITNEGPLIVEGNHNMHLSMAQMACGGFKNHDYYKKILNLK